jgi:RHS repeat-associated protein
LNDHLGSEVAITNDAGNLINQQRYMPFGQVRYLPGTPAITSTDFGYTGQRNLDPQMGLMDYKARFYSPLLGRFVQPDTLIPNAESSQVYNRYSYVFNNPIIYSDPDGHNPILVLIAIALLLSACSSPNGQDAQTVLDSTVGLKLETTDGQFIYEGDSLGTYLGDGQIYTHDHFDKQILSMKLYNSDGELVYSTSDFDRTVIDPTHGSIITVGDDLNSFFAQTELVSGESVNLQSGTDVISPIWKEKNEDGIAIPTSGITTISGNITPDNDFENPNGHYNGIKWSAPTGQTTKGDSGGGFWVWRGGKLQLVGNLRQGATTSTSSIYLP